ncbi:hypothetical protein LS684_22965 (plasmid) [Cytobacillus spongiae]|nr:hypothetical protein [Cytobacillus spongiae]UII58458.1 hypothetical protein LS684_22965 [Cytobacillus spongiae]
MTKKSFKQFSTVIYTFGSIMTVIAFLVSFYQTKSIIKAIKKYSPYN